MGYFPSPFRRRFIRGIFCRNFCRVFFLGNLCVRFSAGINACVVSHGHFSVRSYVEILSVRPFVGAFSLGLLQGLFPCASNMASSVYAFAGPFFANSFPGACYMRSLAKYFPCARLRGLHRGLFCSVSSMRSLVYIFSARSLLRVSLVHSYSRVFP